MKKIVLILQFAICCGALFPESDALAFLSLDHRYNTLAEQYKDISESPVYYFFNFDGYSEAIFWEEWGFSDSVGHNTGFWTLQLAANTANHFETFGGGLSMPLHYSPYNGTHGARGYSSSPSAINMFIQGIEYSFNGYLKAWAISAFSKPVHISYNITQQNQGGEILIDSEDPDDGTMPPHHFKYYNIPKDRLLDLYLKLYLEGIDYILDKQWESRNRISIKKQKTYIDNRIISKGLESRTSRELAIFRNYIFARHNYRFRSDEWNIFFRKYYNPNYSGVWTNEEVMRMLSPHEEYILNLIVKYERGRRSAK